MQVMAVRLTIDDIFKKKNWEKREFFSREFYLHLHKTTSTSITIPSFHKRQSLCLHVQNITYLCNYKQSSTKVVCSITLVHVSCIYNLDFTNEGYKWATNMQWGRVDKVIYLHFVNRLSTNSVLDSGHTLRWPNGGIIQ